MKPIRIPGLLLGLLITFSLVTNAVWAAAPAPDLPTQPPPPNPQLSTGTAPQAVQDSNGTQSLSGSNVTFAPSAGDECYLPGETQTLCFQSDTYTTDYEYIYNNWLRFPNDWVVNSIAIQGSPVCDDGGFDPSFGWSFQTASYEVNIAHMRYQNTADHCVATYCVNVTAGASSGTVPVSWYFDGDGYGGAPHWPCSSDGYTPAGMTACDQSIAPTASVPRCSSIDLTPPTVSTSSCSGEDQPITLNLANNTGDAGTFNLTYDWNFQGTVSGPSSISLANGAAQDFEVILSPHACLQPDEFEVEVTANGGGFNDTALITTSFYSELHSWKMIPPSPTSAMDNVLASYDGLLWHITGHGSTGVSTYDPQTKTWTSIADSAPGFNNYARSGCQIGEKVYIYGDTAGGYSGLWSYNMQTNVWQAETPGGTPPPQTSIWAPAWVADPDNARCYLTGGATSPGGGNLTSAYVYDAAANAWLTALPAFTSPRDFHAGFLFNRPSDGHDLLCVAGGVNSSGSELNSTQCYDMQLGAWNAENADLGALATAWWGMGYAQRTGQLWMVGGAQSGNPSANTAYYDIAAQAWVGYGALESGIIYRTAAAALDGIIYHVGGSPSGFNPVNWADASDTYCPACTEPVIKFSPGVFNQVLPPDSIGAKWALVCNRGGAPLTYSMTDGSDWLTQEPAGGTIAPGNCDSPSITFNSHGLSNGSYATTLTITHNGSFKPAIQVPVSLTVQSSPRLQVLPAQVEMTVINGESVNTTLTIQNLGDLPMHWRMVEWQMPTKGHPVDATGQGEWLQAPGEGVLLDANGGSRLAHPSAYRWNAPQGGGMSVLVYSDDYYHPAPNTPLDQALRYLGLSYTAYYEGNFSGFIQALENEGPWDLVLFANDNYYADTALLDALLEYVNNDGQLILNCWWLANHPTHPLWATLGVTWIANDITPPNPVHWWVADPIFEYYDTVPELTNPVSGAYGISGQHVEPLPGFTALAGFTDTPTTNEAALVRNSAGTTIFKAFLDGQMDDDQDSDAMLDVAELWANLVRSIPNWDYPAIPWLTASDESGALNSDEQISIGLHFESSGMQAGEYDAGLVLFNTALGQSPRIIPVRFNVVTIPLLEKEAPAQANPGQPFPYTIRITPYNFNPMSLHDVLPDGVEYVPGSLMVTPDVGSYGYDAPNRTIHWNLNMPEKSWQPARVHGSGRSAAVQSVSPASAQPSAPASGYDPKMVLWDQPLSSANQNAYINQEFGDLPTYSSFLADDFVVDEAWQISRLFIPGSGWNGFNSLANATSLNFLIYADAGGVPDGDPSGRGNPPLWALSLPPTNPQITLSNGTGSTLSNTLLSLDTPIILPPGHYWFVFYPTMNLNPHGQFGRQPADTSNHGTAQLVNPGNGLGLGDQWMDWTILNTTQTDLAFRIEGEIATPLEISFNVIAEVDDFIITNTAMLNVSGFPVEDSAETYILPYKRMYLPAILR